MEAASKPRDLAGDKAQRIVDAMRASVARRGAAGSTFDHVAREAGVSRGLLHYYFGTKERLLVEVVRRDTEIRMAALDGALAGRPHGGRLHRRARAPRSKTWCSDPEVRDPVVRAVHPSPGATRRSAPRWPSSTRRTREHVSELLEAKQREGISLRLHDSPPRP